MQLKKCYRQIIGVKDDRGMWAISKHFGEEQFDFFILMETDGLPEVLPAGMISFQVPPLTYAHARHPQDENPEATYRNVYQWIKANGFQLSDKAFTHMEFYPIDQDLSAPELDIYVPIIRSPQ
ncbi:GyrI-like domain-containing protein [Bacillus sp. JJ675]